MEASNTPIQKLLSKLDPKLKNAENNGESSGYASDCLDANTNTAQRSPPAPKANRSPGRKTPPRIPSPLSCRESIHTSSISPPSHSPLARDATTSSTDSFVPVSVGNLSADAFPPTQYPQSSRSPVAKDHSSVASDDHRTSLVYRSTTKPSRNFSDLAGFSTKNDPKERQKDFRRQTSEWPCVESASRSRHVMKALPPSSLVHTTPPSPPPFSSTRESISLTSHGHSPLSIGSPSDFQSGLSSSPQSFPAMSHVFIALNHVKDSEMKIMDLLSSLFTVRYHVSSLFLFLSFSLPLSF
jgi:hypothetical protein